MSASYDVAVVGAGIVGLAHAWAAGRQGLKTIVLERGERAQGASIRNFGFVWPIGQAPGEVLQCALRSREIWLEVLKEGNFWFRTDGSLHAAGSALEAQVLEEFSAQANGLGFACSLLDPAEALQLNPFLNSSRLISALHSRTEIQISSREVIAGLPRFLNERHGVEFRFGTSVLEIDGPKVRTTVGEVRAERVVVCSGDDFQTLFPSEHRAAGMAKCKLQMMAVDAGIAPGGFGPCVTGGLSMRYYHSFRAAPSVMALAERFAADQPLYDRWGIHVMAGQGRDGELIVGDSHEYGDPDPFNNERIDDLILEYLNSLLALPICRVTRRWHGVYARHPDRWLVRLEPAPHVHIVNALSGSGMTLAFGVAEATFS